MIDISNGTALVSAVAASGLANFLAAVLTIFGAAVVAHLAMDYFHNKHIENLGKQLVDVATLNVQANQSMIAVAITAKQGMDITDKVITVPAPSTDKKAQ